MAAAYQGPAWLAGVATVVPSASVSRVHVTGASGAGTSTLGAALAGALDAPHLDTDDYFWEPTDPPYEIARAPEARLSLLTEELDRHPSWVLSGSLCGWGDPVIPRFELVVFLWVPREIRLARLRERELRRFGAAALAPGGAMHANHEAFLEWAASYDEGGLDMRSRARPDAWLGGRPGPLLRPEGERPVEAGLAEVLRELAVG